MNNFVQTKKAKPYVGPETRKAAIQATVVMLTLAAFGSAVILEDSYGPLKVTPLGAQILAWVMLIGMLPYLFVLCGKLMKERKPAPVGGRVD
ncbi:MAG: hypothetical protein ABI361_03330 [Nitrososphaera sp.]|jgi:hypothetical protein